jgi:uncharacterized protein YdeI (YjbR/CyaY-like superfamily)
VASARLKTTGVSLPANAVQAHTPAAWRAWLAQHHGQATGVWLVMWKKASGQVQLVYEQAVVEALCFGWIDSKPNKLDDQRSLLWFAPRKAGTNWSRLNKTRALQAIAEGRMAAPGLAKIAAAKADGSWSALDAVEDLVVPPDLQEALQQTPPAAANFAAFARSAKRGILEWINNAKTTATRDKRIQNTAEMAARNERANQWRK